jgi:adenylate cyclase
LDTREKKPASTNAVSQSRPGETDGRLLAFLGSLSLRNNALPLAIKWSLSISALIMLVMALLGWFLINQQKESYHHQTERLGEMITEQLARAASEPLMADDVLALEVLVSQQKKNDLIMGMQVFDLDGMVLASAGSLPGNGDNPAAFTTDEKIFSDERQIAWSTPDSNAISFIAPVYFQKTQAGSALVSIDKRPLEKNLVRLIKVLIAMTLVLMTLGTALAFPLAYRLCRPIRRLVEAGEAIDRGEAKPLRENKRKDEIGKVFGSLNRMATDLERKKHIEKILLRYISPGIAQRVLGNTENGRLGGDTTEGSVLFCDIVGYTELSEELSPKQVSDLLNDYFRYFALAGSSCQGTIDQFIGDCIMILFGVPEKDSDHAVHAVTCAVLIQMIADQINLERQSRGQTTVQFRIGINSGLMLAGNVGSEERMQYTVVGDAVNVASRICALSEPGGILLTGETARQPGVEHMVKPTRMAPINIRGRKNPVTPYGLDRRTFLDAPLVSQSLARILPGERATG